MKHLILVISILAPVLLFGQEPAYKHMMDDLSVNFYDVVAEAEAYFSTIDKSRKGTGWKPYQRWKYQNEPLYYPTGDRSQVRADFAAAQYQSFVKKNGEQDRELFPSGWHELGPLSVDSITGHYAAGIGRVEDFYVDPNNSNKVYLGSRSGGFWRSDNGGNTWSGGSTDFLVASGVNTIAVSPTNPDSILINVRNANNGHSHGVYRSTNGGVTWTETDFNPVNVGFGGLGSSFQVYNVTYHPRVPNLIFVGTSKGIYRSADNLQTWTRLIDDGDIEEIQFHPTDNDIIYLYDSYYWGANKNRVMRSVNQGLTYTTSQTVAGNNDNRSVVLRVSEDCADCLYWASNNGVWKSIDKGINFTFLVNPDQGCGGFTVSDVDTSFMVYGYLDLTASTDGGNTFEQKTWWSLGNTNGAGSGHHSSYFGSTNYIHADLRMAKSINGVFYVGTDGQLAKSEDNGTTWVNISEGVGIRENYSLGTSQSNHYRSMSGSQDNGTSIKIRDQWVEFYGADGMEAIIHPLNADWMIGSLQNGGRRRTFDAGASQDGATPSGGSSAYWEAPLAYDPNDQMTVYDFREQVYKSTKFGSDYVQLGSPTTFTGVIKQAEIAENNSNIIIITKDEFIEKSTNGGVSFTNIKNGLPNSFITDIAFDPNDDDTFIVTYSTWENNGQKIYLTSDGGSTYTNITHNLGNMPIRCVVIDHTDASNIYVGAEIGVFTKPMSGNTWTAYNSQLPNTSVRELEINYGSNTLKAATWGRGLWEYTLVDKLNFPAIVETNITDPTTFSHPRESFSQFVTSKVHYDGTLSSVYLEWSQGSPTFGNTIAMSNTSDSTWVSDSAIPSQVAGTKMYFKVYAVGDAQDTTETYKFMYTVRPYEYCSGDGDDESGNLYIDDMSLANVSNSTGNDDYTYYATPEIEMDLGEEYTLSVSANTGWSDNDFGAFIDWNNDKEFSQDELVLFDTNSGSDASITFTVPTDAVVDVTTRMRLRLSYWGSNPTACGTAFGEVEDYAVRLTSNNCKVVSTTTDNGPGSLRAAVACAAAGDTITFHDDLQGQTIVISSSSITLDKDLTILSSSSQDITVSSLQPQIPSLRSVFGITNTATVQMIGFQIDGAYGLVGSAIINSGVLTLVDMTATNGGKSDIQSTVNNTQTGSVTVLGDTKLD